MEIDNVVLYGRSICMPIKIKMESSNPLDQSNINGLNNKRNLGVITNQNINSLNNNPYSQNNMSQPAPAQSAMQQPTYQQQAMQQPTYQQPVIQQPTPAQSAPVQQMSQPVAAATMSKPVPSLINPVQKGQKVNINSQAPLNCIKAAFGWNTLNSACDCDVSAFMLGDNSKVLGDDWFVFYGQTDSPDHSTQFINVQGEDREVIQIDVRKLNPAVKKIVFVLTINEALEKRLNFSMMKDAYVRIFNGESNEQLVSFQLSDYYANVTSMMIGEVYLHNGTWKFNAIGNGVARDLAGLCEFYGVQVQ